MRVDLSNQDEGTKLLLQTLWKDIAIMKNKNQCFNCSDYPVCLSKLLKNKSADSIRCKKEERLRDSDEVWDKGWDELLKGVTDEEKSK